jgi:anti-sigma factor RsiW
MKGCEECQKRMDAFLDEELRGPAEKDFQSHLAECESCTARVNEQRAFFQAVRASRPSESAPAALRERVRVLVERDAQAKAVGSGFWAGFGGRWMLGWLSSRAVLATGLSVTVIAVTWMVWSASHRSRQAEEFRELAVQAHKEQLAGELPLQVKTESTTALTQWFTTKVPFSFRLPEYQGISGKPPSYRLMGGRVIRARTLPAAYVAYEMHNDLISLVMTTGKDTVASGGEVVHSGGVSFHSERVNGLQVVTWTVHDLTYALVSDVTVPAGESCIVCHSGNKGRDPLREFRNRAPKSDSLRGL